MKKGKKIVREKKDLMVKEGFKVKEKMEGNIWWG